MLLPYPEHTFLIGCVTLTSIGFSVHLSILQGKRLEVRSPVVFFSNYPLLLSTTISILDLFIFRKFIPHRALILLTIISFLFLPDCLLKKFQGDFFFSITSVRHLINWLFQCLSTISAHSVDLQSGKGKPANDKMCTIWCDLSMW